MGMLLNVKLKNQITVDIDVCASKWTKWCCQEQLSANNGSHSGKPANHPRSDEASLQQLPSSQHARTHHPKRVSDRLIISDPSHQPFQSSDNRTASHWRAVSWGHFTRRVPERAIVQTEFNTFCCLEPQIQHQSFLGLRMDANFPSDREPRSKDLYPCKDDNLLPVT